MAGSFKDALLNKGLITQEQVNKAEQEKAAKAAADKAAQEKRERINRYPKDRHGKPVAYAKWIAAGKLPVNLDKLCCICGREGLDRLEAFEKVMRNPELDAIRKKMDAGEKVEGGFFTYMEVQQKAAAEIGKAGTVLLNYPLAQHMFMLGNKFAVRLLQGKSVMACVACIRHEFPQLWGPNEEGT